MGATVAEIRAALETRLATIPAVQTSAYMLDNPLPPTMQVMGPDVVLYDQAGARGLDAWTFVIQAFSGSPETQAAQINLDAWLDPFGPNSVKAAIEGDRSLGGVVEDCWVRQSSGYREYVIKSGIKCLGADWDVLVFNLGT